MQDELVLNVAIKALPRFFQIFTHGIIVKGAVGCNLEHFLAQEAGIEPAYLEQRVQTIFLNGQPVDDVAGVTVESGATVALSAAMPGVLGAMLRKEGFYATMRGTISHRGSDACSDSRAGQITLKLFNLLTRELGPALLKKGIWVERAYLADYLAGQADDFWQACHAIKLNGETCLAHQAVAQLAQSDSPTEVVLQLIPLD